MADIVHPFRSSLRRLAHTRPTVHAVAGGVVTPFIVDVAGAMGARPRVTHAPDEARHLAAQASGVLVNLAQPDPLRREGARQAAEAAQAAKVPWVLDPVLAQATPERRKLAERLLAFHPAIITPNREELAALVPPGAQETPEGAACALARETAAVVLASGEVDIIADGDRTEHVKGGHPFMDMTSGYGCALGMACAVMLTVAEPFEAACAAAHLFKAAGTRAATRAKGPGSFRMAFIDALWALAQGETEGAA